MFEALDLADFGLDLFFGELGGVAGADGGGGGLEDGGGEVGVGDEEVLGPVAQVGGDVAAFGASDPANGTQKRDLCGTLKRDPLFGTSARSGVPGAEPPLAGAELRWMQGSSS